MTNQDGPNANRVDRCRDLLDLTTLPDYDLQEMAETVEFEISELKRTLLHKERIAKKFRTELRRRFGR